MRRRAVGSTNQPMPALWTGDFVRVTSIQLLTFLSFQLTMPVLPLYLSDFTSHEGVIGAAVGVFTLSAIAVRLWIAPAVDRGRRPILIDGLIWFVIATGLYALTDSTGSVLAVRLLHGAAFGAATTATSAMAADVIPAARRGEGMGLFGVSVNVSQSTAPIIAFALVAAWGFQVNFLVATMIGILAWSLARTQGETVVRRPPQDGVTSASRTARSAIVEVSALLPSLLIFGFGMALGGVFGLISLYATEQGMHNPGPLFTVMAIAVICVRPLSGRLADRLGPTPPASAGLLAAAASLYVIGRFPADFYFGDMPGGLLVGAALLGFGNGVVLPIAQGVSIARSPKPRWGAASATFLSALDLGIGSGAFFLGAIAAKFDLATAYRWAALLPVAGVCYLLATRKHWYLRKPDPAATIAARSES